MRETDYAYCVARIRANESYMLTSAFINKLVEADSYERAVTMLTECGWIESDGNISDFIKVQNNKLWNLLSECVPDRKMLDCLCVLNDFYNIKAAVKCLFTGEKIDSYYIRPSTLDLEGLTKAIRESNFSLLSDATMSKAAEEAYYIAGETENGQNAEIIIDCAALEMLSAYAERYRNTVFSEVSKFNADTSNIKTAFRCALTKKGKDFIESAVATCFFVDRNKLILCALEGTDKLNEYLSNSIYSDGVSLFIQNPAAYDKWCDDYVVELIKKSRYTAFGFDPVCAYYYAKLTEIKTVRIILSGKQSGLSKDILKERVRASYV